MSTVNPSRNKSNVTVEEVRHIAELSNLRLTQDEESAMQRDLSAILSYVAELDSLDTSAVEPMAQVGEVLRGEAQARMDSREFLRTDQLVPSLPRGEVMASAPDSDGIFFKVPKVIER